MWLWLLQKLNTYGDTEVTGHETWLELAMRTSCDCVVRRCGWEPGVWRRVAACACALRSRRTLASTLRQRQCEPVPGLGRRHPYWSGSRVKVKSFTVQVGHWLDSGHKICQQCAKKIDFGATKTYYLKQKQQVYQPLRAILWRLSCLSCRATWCVIKNCWGLEA